ncbi:MAG: hypothetical protein PVJ53_01525 [Desulfobacterales bacterium]
MIDLPAGGGKIPLAPNDSREMGEEDMVVEYDQGERLTSPLR